jgi:hypothetical protein
VATPLVSAPVPRLRLPEEKATVPVGLLPVTVAVRVIICFSFAVSVEEASAVVVPPCATTTVTLLEVLAALVALPLYAAVITYDPAFGNET